MITKESKRITIASLLLLFVLALCIAVGTEPKGKAEKASEAHSTALTAEGEENTVDIVKDGKSDYTIIFSASDTSQADADLAKELSTQIRRAYGVTIRYRPDESTAESDCEILIGETDRAFSATIADEVARLTKDDNLVFIIAESDGKLACIANSGEAYAKASDALFALLGEESFTVDEELYVTFVMTREEYDKELADKEAAETEAKLKELQDKIAAFDTSLFGDRDPMPEGVYNRPYTYPSVGQHPRLNLTADMLPDIQRVLDDPAYADLAEDFWKTANTETDGILKDVSTLSTTYNWVSGNSSPSNNALAVIEAKALAYLLTGNKLYGYQAIYAAKNHMLTLEISHDIASDIFRIYGYSMMVTGEVYDWCYDLMTDLDKEQFVRGVQKFYCEDCVCGSGDKMTIGFPPTGQNAIAGHGTNVALHRDYVAFSIAIFDEYPDWWNLVGGRFYEEFVPANNVFYKAGMNTQGTNTYIWGKGYAQIYSAWLVYVMSGEMPYDSGLEDFVYGLMGLRLPNGKVFQSGDGKSSKTGHADSLKPIIYIAQALFPSEMIQKNAKILTDNYTSYDIYNSNFITPTTSLIFRANGLESEIDGEKSEGLDLIWYYGSPMGLMTVRDSWDEDAAAVYMKVGEVSGTNHDHQDAGTFQIYYKGCFTSESSVYGESAGYGTSAHDKWAQATIAHNGLLVYNPALVENEIVWGERAGAPCVSNRETYFYSGSQRIPTAPATPYDWEFGEKCDMGTVTGHDQHQDINGTVKYAYLAGDISTAYSTATVETIERRMLSIYTGIEEFPMFFVVYDYMKSKDASFQKSFLLHVSEEPVVDGNTAYFEQEGGKIVLTTLTSDAVIRTYGGEEYGTYWINGYENEELGISIPGRKCNIAEAGGGTAADKGDEDFLPDNDLWGRIQIDNMGKLEDHLLNVIYVTDAGNENALTPVKFENEQIIGMQLEDVITVFNKTESKNRAVMEFTTEGKGLREYYVSGMSEGSWTVYVDDVVVAHAHTSGDSGLITFTAPAGDVRLEPGRDVRPANSDDIKFTMNGGILPDDIVHFYTHDVEYVLPELVSTPDMEFAGWYADEVSTERLYTIPVGTRGTFKVFAKWYRSYIEDYETTEVNVIGASKEVNNFTYAASSKPGASFKTVKDETTGNTYLLWQCGEKDPQFDLKASMPVFLADKTAITFKLDIALDGDNDPITSGFYLRGTRGADSSVASSNKRVTIFNVTASGDINLGGNAAYKAGTLTKDFQTFTFSADFEKELIYAFDTEGNIIGKLPITLPKAFIEQFANPEEATVKEYMNGLFFLFDWYTGTQSEPDHALRIDNIKVSCGLPKNAIIPDESAPNAIIYHNLGNGKLPVGSPYYYDAENETALPESCISSENEFLGWYSDENFTKQVFSVPAGLSSQFNVYARWRMELSEDYEGKEFEGFDIYCPDAETTGKGKTINGFSYEIDKKTNAGFKTVKDGDNTYLVWSPGSADPFLRVHGCLNNYIGAEKSVTYKVSLALEDGMTPSATAFRVQEIASKSFAVFTTSTNGDILLGGKSNLKIGTLSGEFIELIITVDFLNATMTAYNSDGSVAKNPDTGAALTMAISKPSTSEAKDLVDYISYTDYGFVWQDTTGKDVVSAIRIDDVAILSGSYVIEVMDPNSTNVYYKNLNGTVLPEDAPKEYDTETGLTLPVLPNSATGKFAGWYLDSLYTEKIDAIPAGTTGPVVVYAKWISLYVETFEGEEVPEGTEQKKIGDISYNSSKKDGAAIMTEKDASGNTYLVWTKGTADPQHTKAGALYDFLGDETSMTFSVYMATYNGRPFIATSLYIRVTGSNSFTLFSTKTDGSVYLGSSADGKKIGQVTSALTKFTVSLDFATGNAYAYDKNGNQLLGEDGTPITVTFTVPQASECETLLEWLGTLSNYNFVWYGQGSGGVNGYMKFDNLSLAAGLPTPGEVDPYEPIVSTCDHEWVDATCSTPKTCSKCGGVEGAPLSHSYSANGVCTVCGAVDENMPYFSEDFESTVLDISNPTGEDAPTLNTTKNNIVYTINTKTGAAFKTVEDGDNTYLVWSKGEKDPQLQKRGALYDFLGDKTSFTFSVKMAKHGESPVIATQFMIRVTGGDNFQLFETDKDGNVYLFTAKKGIKIGTITEELTTFTFSFDFATATLRAHNTDGSVMQTEDGTLCEMTVSVPSASVCGTMLEWLRTLANTNFVWYAPNASYDGAELAIDDIILKSGVPVEEPTA